MSDGFSVNNTYLAHTVAFSAGPDVQPGDIDVTGQTSGYWPGVACPSGWGVVLMRWKMSPALMTNDGVVTAAADGLMGVAGDALQVNIPGTTAEGEFTAGSPQSFTVDADIGFNPTINGPSLGVSGRIVVVAVLGRLL